MILRFSIFLCLFSFFQIGYSQKISIKDTIYITECDTGSQGKTVLDLEAIKNSLFTSSQNSNSPTIYLAAQGGSVIKIVNLLSSPTVKDVCLNLSQGWTDIALNKDKEIYLCTTNSIYKLDTTTCTLTLFYSISASNSVVALSFDTKNNLYYSDGSAVYRFNNTTGSPVLWHDFGSGYASGDFVMKNGKMYISWVLGGIVRLYEVSVDNNINYVSHIDKCSLKAKTYGLASELGILYGVTPTELYKIDDNLCQNTTIISNNSGTSWYGAAGLHEAQNSISAHLNYTDAIAISNPIMDKWTNTIPYNQLIYLTIDDKIKDSLFIYPLKITIKPKSNTTIYKTICKGSNYAGYSKTGTYLDKFNDRYGCDSLRTLNLSVVDNIRDTFRVSICQGQSYRTYTTAGTYLENYKTINGCDSILYIELKVNKPSIYSFSKTICTGKIFMGKSTSGIYTFIYTNSVGCDSTVTLNLSVVTIVKPFITIYKCINPGQRIPFLTKNITSPGIYIDSTNYVTNCDTIFRWIVSLVNPSRDTMSSVQCQGYNFKGTILNNDTALMDTMRSYLGCDSIYILNKIKVQKYITSSPINLFFCDTFIFNNHIFSRDTVLYTSTKYIQAPFCDSLRQKYNFIKSPKPIVSIYSPTGTYCIKGETITLEAKGANRYLWSTYQTDPKINLYPTQNTTYRVIGWTNNNCIDSAFIDIEVEDPVTIDVPKAFSPNGDGQNDFWSINSNGNYQILSLEVFNRWGENVFSASPILPTWNGFYKGNLLPSGIYSYLLSVRKNRQIYEKTGEVMLVR